MSIYIIIYIMIYFVSPFGQVPLEKWHFPLNKYISQQGLFFFTNHLLSLFLIQPLKIASMDLCCVRQLIAVFQFPSAVMVL